MDELEDIRWWPDEEPHDKVMRRARAIARDQQWRRAQDELHLHLYSEAEWRGVYGIDRRRAAGRSTTDTKKNRLSINVVRNMCNAATSMLIRSRPYVNFQTDGADYSLMCLSRKRERFVQAHFMRERIHQTSQARVRNAAIFGTGGTKVIRRDGKIRYENILPGEILVDEQEGMAGDPPCIYQAKIVDKIQLAAMYPEHKVAIMKAGSQGAYNGVAHAAQCLVVYGWHFRSTLEDTHDGVEALCIDGATLYTREYRWLHFPGTFYRWEESPFGFYGVGIPSELVGIQYEINALLRMVRDATYYGGNLKILAEKGANINFAQLNNSTRIPIVEYVGKQPAWVANDLASPQLFSHLQYLVQTAYNVTGISQLDAQSQTPAASMSGRARLVHQNNESLRFKAAVERYENGYVELAERTLEAATDEYDENGDQDVIFRGHEHLEEIKLSDVMLDGPDESLDIQRWSSSQLAQSPGARMEQVDFLVQNQYIPRNRGLVMMDLGNDFRAEMDIQNAPYNLIDERIERMLFDGEPQSPSPLMDLEYAKMRVQLEIQRCEMRKGVPPDRIDLLREFFSEIVDLLAKAKAGDAALNPPPPAQLGAPGTNGPPLDMPPMPGQANAPLPVGVAA
jgi:hypothetical protein